MRWYTTAILGGAFGLFIAVTVPEPVWLGMTLILIGSVCLGIIVGSYRKKG